MQQNIQISEKYKTTSQTSENLRRFLLIIFDETISIFNNFFTFDNVLFLVQHGFGLGNHWFNFFILLGFYFVECFDFFGDETRVWT